MKPTQTGIAVALALVVVIAFFIFPGLWPFSSAASLPNKTATTNPANNNQSTETTTTMPNENITKLQSTDETIGTGATAVAGDTVVVTYIGALTNGTVFDASAKHPNTKNGFQFTLGAGQVIKGWDQGIVGMKEGGKRKLVIPASLAYGDQAIGNIIPANSTLVFEVELLKVIKNN